jgi:hypothetical protein
MFGVLGGATKAFDNQSCEASPNFTNKFQTMKLLKQQIQFLYREMSHPHPPYLHHLLLQKKIAASQYLTQCARRLTVSLE